MGSCAAPSAKGDDKFITTDYLQQCRFKTKYSVSQLAAAGLTPTQPLGNHQQASLLRLDVGTGYEYWYGLPNFYTITRYNHSTHYAMAVWQLGLAVAQARGGY